MTIPRKDKIKIVFFDEAVAFGGSVVVLARLFAHIDRSRFTPLLVTSLDKASIEELFDAGDLLHWLRLKLHYGHRVKWMTLCPSDKHLARKLWAYAFSLAAFVWNLREYTTLFFKLARTHPKLIHINNGSEGPLMSRLLRTPAIWHLHGITSDFMDTVAAAKDPDATFICISQFVASDIIKKGVVSRRIFIIPNPIPEIASLAIDRDEWMRAHNIPSSATVFAHVGRVVKWKGQLEFLSAFSRVAQKRPDVFALIVGDDVEGFSSEYPASLRRFVDDHGLKNRVIFTSHVRNVVELMRLVDIVVHSSIEPEPFGLVIIEAMLAGAAVIAARLGAPIEIIQDGVTGLLVDPFNVTEFSSALERLVSDPEYRLSIAKAGAKMVRERYSAQQFARRIEAVYEDTAATSGK